jgi:hypothetical protein
MNWQIHVIEASDFPYMLDNWEFTVAINSKPAHISTFTSQKIKM